MTQSRSKIQIQSLLQLTIQEHGDDEHPDTIADRLGASLDEQFPDAAPHYLHCEMDDWSDDGKYSNSTATITFQGIEYSWGVSRSGSYHSFYYFTNDADVYIHDPKTNRVLVQYFEDFGRMGEVESMFVCTVAEFEMLSGLHDIYLGEVLGKHSEVFGNIADNIQIKSDDTEFVAKLEKLLGSHISGICLDLENL